jgi:hypothetical protein
MPIPIERVDVTSMSTLPMALAPLASSTARDSNPGAVAASSNHGAQNPAHNPKGTPARGRAPRESQLGPRLAEPSPLLRFVYTADEPALHGESLLIREQVECHASGPRRRVRPSWRSALGGPEPRARRQQSHQLCSKARRHGTECSNAHSVSSSGHRCRERRTPMLLDGCMRFFWRRRRETALNFHGRIRRRRWPGTAVYRSPRFEKRTRAEGAQETPLFRITSRGSDVRRWWLPLLTSMTSRTAVHGHHCAALAPLAATHERHTHCHHDSV